MTFAYGPKAIADALEVPLTTAKAICDRIGDVDCGSRYRRVSRKRLEDFVAWGGIKGIHDYEEAKAAKARSVEADPEEGRTLDVASEIAARAQGQEAGVRPDGSGMPGQSGSVALRIEARRHY